jgi:uncharacterized protein (DUF1684 family)
MKQLLKIFVFLCCISTSLQAQPKNYVEKIKAYQKVYVQEHEVVLKNDKKYFRFFPADEQYRVVASFKKITDTVGFIMKTSGSKSKKYFRYGRIQFMLHDSSLHLTVYQSEQLMTDTAYQNYLFLPFTDLTSGEESYAGGRYLDMMIHDIKNDCIIIDFNKVYNPYCAYTTGYNCPIPPRENDMPVAIKAGEKAFGK